jgi:hypothetical protein
MDWADFLLRRLCLRAWTADCSSSSRACASWVKPTQTLARWSGRSGGVGRELDPVGGRADLLVHLLRDESLVPAGHVGQRSDASNLVSGDTNARMDVFFFDATTSSLSRVNVTSWGGQTTPSTSSGSDTPRVSDNGRYVVFSSSAPDLVSGDSNGWDDIFVRDRVAGTTTRVNTASDGSQGINGSSRTPFISNDGSQVMFHSYAWNLAPGGRGVFVKTLATGALARVDVAWDGSLPSVGGDYAAASTDFQNVVFYSPATNIVQGDTNAQADIFFADNPAL